MPLEEEEFQRAKRGLATLVDCDEPEALILRLRKIAETKAENASAERERERWSAAAAALARIDAELEAANQPKPAAA